MSMDFLMNGFSHIDFLAVIVGTVSTFWVSWIWYSPLLFRKMWMQAHLLSESDMRNAYMLPVFLSSFGLSFLAACAMAWLLGPAPTVLQGLMLGAIVGICLVLPVSVPKYLISRKLFRLLLIDAAHDVLVYLVMGGIIGAMQ